MLTIPLNKTIRFLSKKILLRDLRREKSVVSLKTRKSPGKGIQTQSIKVVSSGQNPRSRNYHFDSLNPKIT